MAELEHLGGKRAESARARRAEQLRRWRRSQTEQEPAERQPRTRRGGPRVRFEDGAVFLAACSSGDTDEVRRLLARGADVDTANVDGLTALHQVGARDARGAPPRPGLSWLLGTGPRSRPRAFAAARGGRRRPGALSRTPFPARAAPLPKPVAEGANPKAGRGRRAADTAARVGPGRRERRPRARDAPTPARGSPAQRAPPAASRGSRPAGPPPLV